MLVVWFHSQWVKCKNTAEEYGDFCLILSVSLAAVTGEQSQAYCSVSWLHSPLRSLFNFVRLAVSHIILNRILLTKKVCSTSGLIMLKSLLWSLVNQLSKYIQLTEMHVVYIQYNFDYYSGQIFLCCISTLLHCYGSFQKAV